MTTTHSKNFVKVKAFYEHGSWGDGRVMDAVVKGWITEKEYKEITGKAYKAP